MGFNRMPTNSATRILTVAILLILFLFQAPFSMAAGAAKTGEQFLDELQKAHFRYFILHSDSNSGLTMDSSREDTACSIAALGFSLTAYIAAAERGIILRQDARNYVLKTLRTLYSLPQGEAKNGVSGYRGFFYHFLDRKTGTRAWNCELSSIDTALLMAGVLSCHSYFDSYSVEDDEIRELAKRLYDRVEWNFMYRPSGYISMGWNPEKGFLESEWSMFCEAPILLILAAGSFTHPVPAPAVWLNYCKNYKLSSSYGREIPDPHGSGIAREERISFAPTYGFQYPACWIDFRGLKDSFCEKNGFDYFENAKRILMAQYNYALQNPNGWRGYGRELWGLTACDGPGNITKDFKGKKVEFRAYSARGCPDYFDDGTVAPTALAASIPYAPDLVLSTLRLWREKRPELWGECGFFDAFNPSFDEAKASGWVDKAYLGIDQGPIVIMTENYRSAFIWDLMKENEIIVNGLKKCGFTGGWLSGEKKSAESR